MIIEDQWASHPTVFDRVQKLEELNIKLEVSGESAWTLFSGTDILQKKLTERLFRYWKYDEKPTVLDLESFKEKYEEDSAKYTFHSKFNHFYEFRDISVFDINNAIDSTLDKEFKTFDELYTEENVDLVGQFSGLDRDIKTLEAIGRKEILVNSLEYDGIKYEKGKFEKLLVNLKKQHESDHKNIKNLDIRIFRFFLNLAKVSGRNEELLKSYEDYFYLLKEDKENLQIYLDLINSMQFIWRVTSFSKIRKLMTIFKEKESDFRIILKQIFKDERYGSFIT